MRSRPRRGAIAAAGRCGVPDSCRPIPCPYVPASDSSASAFIVPRLRHPTRSAWRPRKPHGVRKAQPQRLAAGAADDGVVRLLRPSIENLIRPSSVRTAEGPHSERWGLKKRERTLDRPQAFFLLLAGLFLQKLLFTLGHSNHPWERFVELLLRHHVRLVADIRSYPGSRKWPQFRREYLEEHLPACGVAYRWFPELGGRRKEPAETESPDGGLESPGFRAYAAHMRSAAFEGAVAELLATAAKRPAALLCAEAFFWRCHRKLLSDYLTALLDCRVLHIFPDGSLREHRVTSFARVSGGKLFYPRPLAELEDRGT